MSQNWAVAMVALLCAGSAAAAQESDGAAAALHPLLLAQASPNPAAARQELELWSKVRDSKSAAEIESFLAAYPNGRLAPIARERLKALQEKPPAPPPGGTAPRVDFNPAAQQQPPNSPPNSPLIGGPGSVAPEYRNRSGSVTPVPHTTSMVAEVQERLFNLNYDPGPINGRMDQATITAITRFQRNFSLPQTGQIDEGFLNTLRDARLPSEWAALAFHARGAYSAVWQRPSRRQAEQEALTECRRRAHGDCKVSTAAGAECIGLANAGGRSRRRRNFGAFAFVAANINAARGEVLEFCQRESPYPDSCEFRLVICADGSQNR